MMIFLRLRFIRLLIFVVIICGASQSIAALLNDENIVEEVITLQTLGERFCRDQYFYLKIVPTDPDYVLFQPGGSISIQDTKAFSPSFTKGLIEVVENGVAKCPVWIYENADSPGREIVIENIDGKIIAKIRREKDYTSEWFVREQYPDLDTYDETYRDWLIACYDPAKVCMRYDLLIGADNVEQFVVVQSFETTLVEEDLFMMMSSWTGPAVTNLRFVAIDRTTNGFAELTVAWPTNGLSTNVVDFFACTNLMEQDWSIAATTNVDLSTNNFSWIDENSTNFTVRFYDCWTLYDGDFDGISDGRELRLWGTDANDWDTDNDGVGDGSELLIYGTDPINTHNSLLPYSTGFESSNSYSIGTLNTQNGWESDAEATVQSGITHTDDQAVELEALEVTMTKHFATTNNSVTTELFIYLGSQYSVPTNLPTTVSSLVSFEEGTGIQAFDGNGSGGGSWSTASDTTNFLNQWVELKIVQNYSAHTWSLYVNDSLKLSSLGFKDNSVTQLEAVHVRSGIGGAVICDDLRIQTD